MADPTRTRQHRDRGMTLTELLVVVALLGMISFVVAGAIIVVFRSQGGVGNAAAESHDVQQAVNYFPLDIQSGPSEAAAYETEPGSIEPGCGDAGSTNVLSFTNGDRRIAYLVSTSGAAGLLDRYECVADGVGWSQRSKVNIADSLDMTRGAPVTATVERADPSDPLVDRVVLEFAQSVSDRELSASPNVDELADEAEMGSCATDNPVAAAKDFGAFVETDVVITGGMIEGPVATGGTVAWVPNSSIAQNKANAKYHGVGLYAGEGIAWNHGNSNKLAVHKGDVVLGGSAVEKSNKITETSSQSGQYVELNGGAKFVPLASYADAIDFQASFDELRACSGALARLPHSCSSVCATEPVLQEPDGDPYVPGVSVHMDIKIGGTVANVLNLPESYLVAGKVNQFNHSGSGLSQTRPLIINVIDEPLAGQPAGHVEFDVANGTWGNLGDYKNVLVNFPNATSVDIGVRFSGTVLAPWATVTTGAEFAGSVIASEWTHSANTVHNDKDAFDGQVDFPESTP